MIQSELIFKEGVNNELRVTNVNGREVLLSIKHSYSLAQHEKIFRKEAEHPDDLDYEMSFEVGEKEIPLLIEFLKSTIEE